MEIIEERGSSSSSKAAATKECKNGCGWSAFGGHPTCCTNCRGPDGQHAKDCKEKNSRIRMACARGCGRPAFKHFPTCCTWCDGSAGSHAADCADKCKAEAASSSEGGKPSVTPMGGGGYPNPDPVKPSKPKPSKLSAPAPTGGMPTSSGMHLLPSGKTKALLIGINYTGTRAQLRGCINDVANMQKLLVETYRWPSHCMRILTDDGRGRPPTKENILDGMRWLVEGARPGDVFVFHYSGHGAQKEDPNGYEEDGMNETILPSDFQKAGMITDDQISDTIVKPLPEGVRMTAVMDCCHSGTGMDLPFMYNVKKAKWIEEVNPFHSPCDVQLFSGCDDDETSADVSSRYGQAGGAMTTAFCDTLRESTEPTYTAFMERLHKVMKKKGFKQRPQLTSSQAFAWDRCFRLSEIVPNSNPKLGRTVRKKFPPRPRKRSADDPLSMMLGMGAGLVGGMLLHMALDKLLD